MARMTKWQKARFTHHHHPGGVSPLRALQRIAIRPSPVANTLQAPDGMNKGL